MKKLIYQIIGYILLVALFVLTTIFMIRTPLPEKYFAFYAICEIAAFLFFSIYGVLIVAIIASFVAIVSVIITAKFFPMVAIISFWCIWFILNWYVERLSEEYGRNKILIENKKDEISKLKFNIQNNEKVIPNIQKYISHYEKIADFSFKLGTTFDLKKISKLIIEFNKNIFPSGQVALISRPQNPCDNWVYEKQKPLLIEEISKDLRFRGKIIDTSSIIACPISGEPRKSSPLDLRGEQKIHSIIRISSCKIQFTPADLRILTTVAFLSSISIKNIALFNHTQKLVITDDLTGIFTHTHFLERLREEVVRSVRYKTRIAFLMIDIDKFKNFNDSFGHQAGDIVLKRVTQRIKHSIRTTDIIGRYGGEEISVILPHTKIKESVKIAENIRKSVFKEKFNFEGKEVRVSVTIGVSSFPECMTTEELVHFADKAMYQGKKMGRNKVVLSSQK